MDMKITHLTCLRTLALGLVAILCLGSASAASITYDGVNYTTSGSKATVAKYTINKTTHDTTFYKGEITIPETFTYNNVTYTVVATAANSFVDCKDLTKVTLPATCVTVGRNSFKNCSSLTNYPVPETATSVGSGVIWGCSSITEAFIPAGVSSPMISNEFAQCSSLKKLVFKDADKAIAFTVGAFGGDSTKWCPPIEDLYIGRVIDNSNYAYNKSPFHNNKTIKVITFGGKATSVESSMFIGCTALDSVSFAAGNIVTSINSGAFQSCTALRTFTFPEAVTVVADNVFNGCKSLVSVTLSSTTTTIGNNAFDSDKALTAISLPATVTLIGSSAFRSSGLAGAIVLPSSLQSIGASAYASSSNITSFAIPASVNAIGNAAFAPITKLAAITVDAANTAFKVTNGVLTTIDGKRLLVTAHEATTLGTTLNDATVESIDDYGMAYSPYTKVTLPALKAIGNNGFAYAKLTDFTLNSGVTVGLNAFSYSALKTFTIAEGVREITQGLCYNCADLATVSFPTTITNMMMNSFAGCAKLESMEIGSNVNYIEAGAVPTTIKSLRVLNVNVPVLAADVFTPDQSAVECKVAAASVDAFKAANQWKYLNIVGDATITGSGSKLGCPTGLYFATTDGKLEYKDNDGNIVNTQFTTGEHAFNLANYKNRIYVGVAGHNFRYQSPTAGEGDGEVFYVNRTGDMFYRVTVLNNVGYEAFQDPFSLTIIPDENKIFIADRNVGIHEMNADTVGLYGAQPFFLQNDWLPYYNDQMSWGAIGCGFTKDTTGVYWMGKKFNGQGIFRFTSADIHTDGGAGKTQNFKVLFQNVQMTTFYLDEANGFIYLFVQKDGSGAGCVPGVYRVPLSVVKEKQDNCKLTDGILVDNSPVRLEGSGDEVTGVTQITGDGTNIYWAYIAPVNNGTTDSISLPGSVAFDANNPLHKSGIKYIPATGDNPTVKFAVEGVEAYGVVAAKFDPAYSGVNTVAKTAKKAIVKGYDVVIPEAARARVITLSGAVAASYKVDANSTVSVRNLNPGLYLIEIVYSNGAKEVVKVIR
jgi:hypothetical protein